MENYQGNSAGNSQGNFNSSAGAGMFDFGASAFNIGLQNLWNRKLIKEQNEYNSPASQMARYQAAGLNPNLIYGQGSPGLQTNIPEVKSPVPMLQPYIQKAIAITRAKKESDLLDKQSQYIQEQIDNTHQKTYLGTLDASLRWLQGEKMRSEQPYWSSNAGYQSDFIRTKVRNQLADIALKNASILNYGLDAQLKRDVHTEKAYYNKLRSETGLDRNDNYLFRSGYNIVPKAYDWISGLFK